MPLTLQIAIGIWLGGLFLTGTFTAYFTLTEKAERNKRRGYPWYYGMFNHQN